MCGVFAYAGEKKVDVKGCLKEIAHRGPDNSGVYTQGEVSLGHCRLSIIDVSERGNQPMESSSGKSVIIFNGEIYNYKELKESLTKRGVVFKSESDTEVIIEGYELDGPDFFKRMRGMWAFVLYDIINSKVVYSRDPFGIKPLYYIVQEDTIYFSSELRCFKKLGLKLEPNKDEYDVFYNLGYFIAPATPYKNVWKLRPGEVQSWDTKKNTTENLFRISRFVEVERAENFSNPSSENALDALDNALTESVKFHYVSDVPVSLLLSGGTDSSLIAALSKKIGETPTAYHVAIPGSEDTVYAEKIAKHLDIPLITETLSEDALHKQYEKAWSILDEPTADVSVIPTSLIFERIKGKAKVVLSGEGGDELFGGYLRGGMLQKNSNVSITNVANSMLNTLLFTNKIALSYTNPIVQRARTLLLKSGVMNDLIGAYLKGVRIVDYPLEDTSVRKKLFDLYKEEYDSRITTSLAFDTLAYLPNDLLYKSDISSMASSVEARVPFADRWLSTEVSRILKSVDTKDAMDNKKMLKQVLERYVPKDLAQRPKGGFGVPIMSYDSKQFVSDFHSASLFHLENRVELGVGSDMANLIKTKPSREIVARKYPRFAFALISNWKFHK